MRKRSWKYGVCLVLALLAASVAGALAQDETPAQTLVTYEAGQCRALVPFGTEWQSAVQDAAAAGRLENVFYDVVDVAVYAGAVWVQVAAAETGGGAYINTNNWPVELDVACIFNSGLGDQPPADAPAGTTFHLRYPFGVCVMLYVPPGTSAFPASLEGEATGSLTETTYIVWDAIRRQDTDWVIVHDVSNRQPVAATVRELTGRMDTSRAVVTPGCVAMPGLLADG